MRQPAHHLLKCSALTLDERVAAMKRVQRQADALALQTGRLTPEELTRKNGVFFDHQFTVDLKSGGRLR